MRTLSRLFRREAGTEVTMPYATNPHDGVRIHYEVEGSGPPLILHVGFMGRLQDWHRDGMVDALQDDFRLILIDPRGQGQSDKPHDVESYALERVVDDVISVQNDLGIDRSHFLGYSMGGKIGFAAGLFAPDRFLSLLLGGSHPYYDQVTTILGSSLHEEANLLAQGMERFLGRCQELYGPRPPGIRELWLENDGKALAAMTLARESYPAISDRLAEISLPTLIYCGSEDEPLPLAKIASEVMPKAHLIVLQGLGHMETLWRCDLVAPHVRAFLTEVGAPA
jgi:pimeloyl-ACP methyl ester carboxylesterase